MLGVCEIYLLFEKDNGRGNEVVDTAVKKKFIISILGFSLSLIEIVEQGL